MALGAGALGVEPLGGKQASSGTTGYTGSAAVAATDTVTAAGVVGVAGGVAFTATATVTASGVVGVSSGASVAATVTITAAGVDGDVTGASVSAVATITAGGSVSGVVGASVAAAASLAATGFVGKFGDANLSATVAVGATGHAHIAFRDVTVEQIVDISQIVTPVDLSQTPKPADLSRVVTVALLPDGGSMKLPPEGREWYVIQFTTAPQVSTLSASFDSEATWVDGELVSGTSDTFRWLVAGPDFNPADPNVVSASYTSIPLAGVTPLLRSYDTPELIQRKGKTITVVQS